MKDKKKKSKLLYVLLAVFCLPIVYLGLAYGHYRSIQPFIPYGNNTADSYYFHDLFGQVFVVRSSGSIFDVDPIINYQKVDGADKKTFQVFGVKTSLNGGPSIIDSGYAKDKLHVYFNGKIVQHADPTTFTAVGFHLGKDDKLYFLYGQSLAAYLRDQDIIIENKPLEILSYSWAQHIVFKRNSEYFLVQLNPPPETIKQITQAEALSYPQLKTE